MITKELYSDFVDFQKELDEKVNSLTKIAVHAFPEQFCRKRKLISGWYIEEIEYGIEDYDKYDKNKILAKISEYTGYGGCENYSFEITLDELLLTDEKYLQLQWDKQKEYLAEISKKEKVVKKKTQKEKDAKEKATYLKLKEKFEKT